ncbi:MAG: hypothetical protein ACFB2W_13745 [Leptolyngbyaceae cyanobacterium]
MLSAEDLLAGGTLVHEIEVPHQVLNPSGSAAADKSMHVKLQPLTVKDLQLISRAAKESDALTSTLMVQRSLVEPEMSVPQVAAMHAGLVQYLLEQVNQISGITPTAQTLSDAMEAPLAKAAFVLSKAFGWTPQEVSELTLGQVLLHLKLLKENP